MWPTRGISGNGERIQVSRQTDTGCLPPEVLLVINDEDAGQQLNFMTKSLEGKGAREECRIHEDALAKGQVVGHRSRLAKGHRLWWERVRGRIRASGKPDLHVRQPEFGLVD